MNCPTGWERKFLITFFITLFLFLVTQIPAMAFGPTIVDVTTKAFSVVWTTGGSYTSCGINLYTNSSYSTLRTDIDPTQIIVETDPGYPGENGKQYGIAKVTVVGLNLGETYYFKVKQDGVLKSGMAAKTELLRGANSNDPNDSDIVSNDVVHKAVYQDTGVPAIGTLVLAEVYTHDADVDTDPPLSDFPLSAWTGYGMIGDENAIDYNPNNISYKQYAAIDMNNLFGRSDNFPLSLEGDDPATTDVNESEIVKFTIVHGTLSVLGGTEDYFTSYGRIDSVKKEAGEKITTAKVSASFKFTQGGNAFAFPFTPPSGYTTGDLLKAIEEAEGELEIVKSIWSYPGSWVETYQSVLDLGGGVIITDIVDPAPLPPGSGCFIIMNKSMTKEVIFYGKPGSALINLNANAGNLVSIPQVPLYYETGDFLLDIEGSAVAGGDSIKSIFSYVSGWIETYKSVLDLGGGVVLIDIVDSAKMSSSNFAFVILNANANNVVDWDPFDSE